MAKILWTEKYRPTTVDGYVFRDNNQKQQVMSWIRDGGIPHLLLSGQAGLGKTTLAKLILNELNVHKSDILEINGSTSTGVDDVRNTIVKFASLTPSGDFRYIIIDECDYLSINAQAALRNVVEKYSNVTRFIFTCNYPHKVIAGIKSRCQVYNFSQLDRNSFSERILHILVSEGVTIEEKDINLVESHIKAAYPDMRKCINNLQQTITDGKLVPLDESDLSSTEDYLIRAISLFRDKKYKEARTIICENMRIEEQDDVFRFAYNNLDFWASTPEQENQAIVYIRDAMAKAPLCADIEINIAAMFVELETIGQ
jgi:replication factor C small subunit